MLKISLLKISQFSLAVLLLGGSSPAFAVTWLDSAPERARVLGAAQSTLDSTERRQLVDDIYEYSVILAVGPGPHDRIGLHRVVRERAAWQPITNTKGIMLLHGQASNFRSAFLPHGATSSMTPEQSMAVYLARRDIDVWGIDLRWALVPDDTSDFSFMQSWGVALEAQDTRLALAVARAARGLSGSGFGKMLLGGHSSGGFLTYAVANLETQRPVWARHVGGIIPMEMIYVFAPEEEGQRNAACVRYAAFRDLYDSGTYHDASPQDSKAIAYLAQVAPDEQSPILPDFTNEQVFIFATGATYATYAPPLEPYSPFYHYLAATFDELGVPLGLQFAMATAVLDVAMTVPSYATVASNLDIEATLCGALDLPFDDHLAQITVPVLYVGAAGGMSSYALYTTTLLGSTDVTTRFIELYPPEYAMVDFGHADLLWAVNAADLAWDAIADWILAH